MSKSTSRGLFGRRSPAQVTVLETRVHHAAARNAKVAFILTALIVGALSAVIAADRIHPILALFAGVFIGVIAGGLVWGLVTVWPAVRLIWWWATEIVLVVVLLKGWMVLADTPSWVRFAVLALVLGVPAGFAPVRRRVVAFAWCVIVRHRLRVAFNQFIVSNRSGTLPLILFAVPTPIGERVWVYLRPGLSLALLESRLDQIAVTCHAISVQACKAGEGTSAYVRFDIKRREVLTATIGSPLVDLVDPATPPAQRVVADLPTALNLGDIPADTPLFGTYKPSSARAGRAKIDNPANGAAPPVDDTDPWV